MFNKKKNIELNIPQNKSADVVKVRDLKSSVFFQTRILVLCLVLIAALCITGTFAYLTWTSNQTPNRATTGEVKVEIIENGSVVSGSATASLGTSSKQIQLYSDNADNRVDEVVRVSFTPEVISADGKGNVFMSETWSAPAQDSSGTWKIKCGLVNLVLASDWQSHYIYKDGTFYYNKTLAKNTKSEVLLTGVTLADGVDASKYGDIKVNVFADAIQSTPAEAPAVWGCSVDDSGNVTVA